VLVQSFCVAAFPDAKQKKKHMSSWWTTHQPVYVSSPTCTPIMP